MREFIWQHWTEKTLAYFTITFYGYDSSLTKHTFIEPNKTNQWTIVRRAENHHAMPEHRKPIHNLPTVYFIEWDESKVEKILVFKNKNGKVIEKF